MEADSGSWEEGGLGVSWVGAREGEVQDTGYRAGLDVSFGGGQRRRIAKG